MRRNSEGGRDEGVKTTTVDENKTKTTKRKSTKKK